jgi:surface carbohydrate biosynthesis protein (TIGR04326 family)
MVSLRIADRFSDGADVAWREFGAEPLHSLPTMVRRDGGAVRDALLDVLHAASEVCVDGRSVVQHLSIGNRPSHWWMGLVHAKRWGEVGVLADLAKLLVLGDLVASLAPDEVTVSLADPRVAAAAAATVRRATPRARVTVTGPAPRRPRALVLHLRAAVHLARRVTWRHSVPRSTRDGAGPNVAMADYLFRLPASVLEGGAYSSRYWGPLPSVIGASGTSVTWLHRFTPHDGLPRLRDARRLVRRLNAAGERHHLLDGATPATAARAVVRYVRLLRASRRLRAASGAFVTERADLRPILEREWNESFRGSHAMSCALLTERITAVTASLPQHERGVYIMENQPWEYALQHAWRSAGHGPLVGVAHSTIRHWDLRYHGARRAPIGSPVGPPAPDLIAVNGPTGRVALETSGMDPARIVEVEALMYLYLAALVRHDDPQGIVVLGELNAAHTQRLVDAVAGMIPHVAASASVAFKPHPLTPSSSFLIPDPRIMLSTADIGGLLAGARCTVVGASGSAVLESACLGIPVVALLNADDLELLPVSSHPLLSTVETPAALADAVVAALSQPTTTPTSGDGTFHLDTALPRWRAVLA